MYSRSLERSNLRSSLTTRTTQRRARTLKPSAPGRPAGALLFTCNGRERRMFRVADHDASTIGDLLDDIPLAGFFAAGEIGPIAGRNALHGFTASMALFVDSRVERLPRRLTKLDERLSVAAVSVVGADPTAAQWVDLRPVAGRRSAASWPISRRRR
jgi:hypothetical protein